MALLSMATIARPFCKWDIILRWRKRRRRITWRRTSTADDGAVAALVLIVIGSVVVGLGQNLDLEFEALLAVAHSATYEVACSWPVEVDHRVSGIIRGNGVGDHTRVVTLLVDFYHIMNRCVGEHCQPP